MKIVVGITGASGVIYGVRLVQILRMLNHEVVLVISDTAVAILEEETDFSLEDVQHLATAYYSVHDFTSPIVSGSYNADGMVVCPASMKTVSAIANGFSVNVITRAADCFLKEGKPLIVVFREAPLNLIHLENLVKLKKAGAVVMPAAPAFYHRPKTLNDMVDFVIGKVLDQLKIDHELYLKWKAD